MQLWITYIKKSDPGFKTGSEIKGSNTGWKFNQSLNNAGRESNAALKKHESRSATRYVSGGKSISCE